MDFLNVYFQIIDIFYVPLILTALSVIYIIAVVKGKLCIRGNKAIITLLWTLLALIFIPKWIGGYAFVIFLIFKNFKDLLINKSSKQTQICKICNFQIASCISLWLSVASFIVVIIAFFNEIYTTTVMFAAAIFLCFICPLFLPLGIAIIFYSFTSIALIFLVLTVTISVPYFITAITGIFAAVKYKQSGGKLKDTAFYIIKSIFPPTTISGCIKMKKELSTNEKPFSKDEISAIIIANIPFAIIFIGTLIIGGIYK